MKKIIIFLTAVFLSSISLFGEPSAKYKELLAKAKQYEQDKKYYFALGTYYDAVAAEQTVEAKEAYDSFIALEKMIRAGNPGYETKDEFEMHDSWKALMKEFESYWSNSENIPVRFYISDIKKVSVNFDTRTTNYKVYIGWNYTPKYKKLRYIFTSGYLKSYRSDWTDFPSVKDDIYSYYYSWPETQASIDESKFPAFGEKNGALYEFFYWEYDENGEKHYIETTGRVRIAALQGHNYELTVSFVDENGTAVLSKKCSPGECSIYANAGDGLVKAEENYSVAFKNVPQSITAKINSGKVKAKVTGASLCYGNTDRHYEKTLDISKITFAPFDSAEIHKDPITSYEPTVAAADFPALLSELNSEMERVPDKFYKIQSVKVSQKLYEAVTGESLADYNPAAPVRVKYYNAIIFCNMLSEKAGLEQAYYVNGKSIDGFYSQIADGFRLPSGAEELSFVDKYNKLELKGDVWTYPQYGAIDNKDKEIILVQNLPVSEIKKETETAKMEAEKKYNEGMKNGVRIHIQYSNMSGKKDYYINVGMTEVTQKQYQNVMGNNPSEFKGENNPVESVTWIDAVKYCNALSEKEGLEKCYGDIHWVYYNLKTGEEVSKEKYDKDHSKTRKEYKYSKYYYIDCDMNKKGYRLPTYMEWEIFSGIENLDNNSKFVDADSWYGGNSNGITHPVAIKKPNSLGLYDVIGNVKEWNENGNYRGNKNMERDAYGCSYLDSGYLKSTMQAGFYYDSDSSSKIGFRVVRTVK